MALLVYYQDGQLPQADIPFSYRIMMTTAKAILVALAGAGIYWLIKTAREK